MRAWMLLALAIAACGDDDDEAGDATPDAAVDAPSDAASNADRDADAAPDAEVVPEPTAGIGYVFVTGDASGSSIYASFEPFAEEQGRCTYETFGACRLDLCTPTNARESAGPITFAVGDAMVVSEPLGGMYPQTAAPAVATGDAIAISAAGDAVPAFAATVEMPAAVMLETPMAIDGAVHVRRDAALVVRFAAGDTGQRVVAIAVANSAERDTLKCSFEPGSSQGEIPRAAIERIASLADAVSGTPRLVVLGEDYERLTVGEWEVRVAARSETANLLVVFE